MFNLWDTISQWGASYLTANPITFKEITVRINSEFFQSTNALLSRTARITRDWQNGLTDEKFDQTREKTKHVFLCSTIDLVKMYMKMNLPYVLALKLAVV